MRRTQDGPLTYDPTEPVWQPEGMLVDHETEVVTPSELLDDWRLTDRERRLLALLTLFAHGRARCWPSDEQIRELSGRISRRAIAQALDRLQATGYIRIEADPSRPPGRVIVFPWRLEGGPCPRVPPRRPGYYPDPRRRQSYRRVLLALHFLADAEGLLCTATNAAIAARAGLHVETAKGYLHGMEYEGTVATFRDRQGRMIVLMDHPAARRVVADMPEAGLEPGFHTAIALGWEGADGGTF